jgi:hypothetical protein
MNLLEEQIPGLKDNANLYAEVLAQCLKDSVFKDTPILVADIPGDIIDRIRNDPCANPDPKLCQAVMDARNVEEMAEIFVGAQQSYFRSFQFQKDISRSGLKLQFGDREFKIPINFINPYSETKDEIANTFRKILDHPKKPEEEGGAGLNEKDALHVLKQIALAYRGQNGTGDGTNAVLIPLMMKGGENLITNFGFSPAKMCFEKAENDNYFLKEKTEDAPIKGMRNMKKDGIFETSEIRFKLPGDPEGRGIRTQLPMISTLKPSPDGKTIEWSCEPRENPPRQIIVLGGCKSESNSSKS